jgi:hypothetical protein
MFHNRPHEIDASGSIQPWRVFRRFTLEREVYFIRRWCYCILIFLKLPHSFGYLWHLVTQVNACSMRLLTERYVMHSAYENSKSCNFSCIMEVQFRHYNLHIFLGFLTKGIELYLLCVCTCVRALPYDTTHFKAVLFINSNLITRAGANLNVSPRNVKFHFPLD